MSAATSGLRKFEKPGRLRTMKSETPPAIDPKLLEDPLFKELVAEGLRIQHRFAAEPVYAKTGKGYLKSEGVEDLQRIKEASKRESK